MGSPHAAWHNALLPLHQMFTTNDISSWHSSIPGIHIQMIPMKVIRVQETIRQRCQFQGILNTYVSSYSEESPANLSIFVIALNTTLTSIASCVESRSNDEANL